jgi:hypothetical protein
VKNHFLSVDQFTDTMLHYPVKLGIVDFNSFFIDIIESLDDMHRRQGKLHCDVKRDNIFLSYNEGGIVAHLGDFDKCQTLASASKEDCKPWRDSASSTDACTSFTDHYGTVLLIAKTIFGSDRFFDNLKAEFPPYDFSEKREFFILGAMKNHFCKRAGKILTEEQYSLLLNSTSCFDMKKRWGSFNLGPSYDRVFYGYGEYFYEIFEMVVGLKDLDDSFDAREYIKQRRSLRESQRTGVGRCDGAKEREVLLQGMHDTGHAMSNLKEKVEAIAGGFSIVHKQEKGLLKSRAKKLREKRRGKGVVEGCHKKRDPKGVCRRVDTSEGFKKGPSLEKKRRGRVNGKESSLRKVRCA